MHFNPFGVSELNFIFRLENPKNKIAKLSKTQNKITFEKKVK